MSSDSYFEAVGRCIRLIEDRPTRQLWQAARAEVEELLNSEPGCSESSDGQALRAYFSFQCEDLKEAHRLIATLCVRKEPLQEPHLRLSAALLLEAGDKELLQRSLDALAGLRQVDLSKILEELEAANFPTDPATLVLNTFPNGVGWFESSLFDTVQGLDEALSALQEQVDDYRYLELDESWVPICLRELLPLARPMRSCTPAASDEGQTAEAGPG